MKYHLIQTSVSGFQPDGFRYLVDSCLKSAANARSHDPPYLTNRLCARADKDWTLASGGHVILEFTFPRLHVIRTFDVHRPYVLLAIPAAG